jgi:hypothetical protein
MIAIEEIPVARIDEYWNMQFRYLVDDGMIVTEEEKKYFQSAAYRDVLKGHMLRTPDTLHMVYFVRDGLRIGASQYCTYKKTENVSFWISGFFLRTEETEPGTNAFRRFMRTQKMTAPDTMR